MSEVGLVNINNLLNQVSIIKKKYDDLAEYTGENYNVFNVLGIYNDELSHSKIIGDFLNVKGSHGQKDTFLKLFLNEINGFEKNTEQLKVLHNFKTENSRTHIEKYIGKVEFSNGQGGRIDILIQEGTNNIIIENKVWAGDQYLQLVRYNNEDKNAPIIYLTLDGKEPSSDSKGDLILGKEFICISYKVEIVRWLENCIKEMANKPIIRESLNQYLVLVKQLTHQSNNYKMKEEIEKILFSNEDTFETAKTISKTLNSIENKLLSKLDRLVDKGKIETDTINKLFLDNNVIKKLIVLKRFTYKGIPLIRYDLVLNEDPYRVIAIEPQLKDYKIYNEFWANDKEEILKDKIYKKLGSTVDFYYNYDDSVDDMFEKILNQIRLINEIVNE